MADKKEPLQEIPGFSQGVRDNSAVRTLKLMQPICPKSHIEMEMRDGRLQPVEDPERQNCQLAGGEWWEDCEKRGHDPYFTTRSWYTKQDVLEEDEQGRLIKTGEQFIKNETRRPNVTQVAISVRLNQGKGAVNKIEKHGFRRLSEKGYYEVCQFRNCQKPVNSKCKSKKFGDYCSTNHLQLIAADAQGELLHYPISTINGPDHARFVRLREKQLREAAVGATDD